MKKEILNFYKQTSMYTDLGYYKDFAKNLPNDVGMLCLLQRMQIIHPADLYDEAIWNKKDSFYGDMTKVSKDCLKFENDMFPTACSIFCELLRRNPIYNVERKAKDKVRVCCREQAIMLAATLKAKGISARVRSGFAEYCLCNGISYDHWITEYYDEYQDRWKLADADLYGQRFELPFDLIDIPYDKFLFGAKAYLWLRQGELKEESILYASNPPTLGMKAALRGLFYDFHCLMNDEIIFLHVPKYIQDKNFELSEDEYLELDALAMLMLNPDENFDELLNIWDNCPKFKIMTGGLNG